MSIKQSQYEALLSELSNREAAIALLKQHRPYLEMLPSLRRPNESVITIPLPIAKIRTPKASTEVTGSASPTAKAVQLPCDLVILTCDPEWKIKMGVEIVVLIHRPEEEFSELLRRWRQTQVLLAQDYEWLMPPRHQHILSEGADRVYPLFVLFDQTLERIRRGLAGVGLPMVTRTVEVSDEGAIAEAFSTE